MRALIATLFILLPTSALAQDINVYVFTTETRDGFTDPDIEQRRDSVKDLRDALDGERGILLVESPDAADVTLEVLSRAKVGTGNYLLWGGAAAMWKKNTVFVGLTAGEYKTAIQGEAGAGIKGHWQRAADNAAKKAREWIKQNRAQLVANRSSR